MNILYKYYSSEFDIEKHLKCPSIKLANTASFNDPFEGVPSDKFIEYLVEKILVHNKIKNEEIKEQYKKSFIKKNNAYGVISLTETHRNMLMWAHYASSHKGVCIGYDINFMPKKRFDQHPIDNLYDGLPKKVTYDRARFDESYFDYSLELKEDYDTFIYKCMMQALTIKGDEWIYEKEHRCIIPFSYADRCLLNSNYNVEQFLYDGGLIKDKHGYLFSNNLPDSLLRYAFAANHQCSMLIDINIEHIKSIYFGSQSNIDTMELIIELVKSTPEKFKHIKLYKYSVSNSLFDLNITSLN